MPVIEIHSPDAGPGRDALRTLSRSVTDCLGIDAGHCWVIWNQLDRSSYYRPEWDESSSAPPVVLASCKETYPPEARARLLTTIAAGVADLSGTDPAAVYVALRRVGSGDLWVRGAVWSDPDLDASPDTPSPTLPASSR